jgi:hypothetical protein
METDYTNSTPGFYDYLCDVAWVTTVEYDYTLSEAWDIIRKREHIVRECFNTNIPVTETVWMLIEQ